MNQLQIFKNELFEVGAKVENETILFDVEQVARCLGFTEVKNSKEYVRWRTVNSYLKKYVSQDVAKGSLIPEPLVYKLAFKASNEIAEHFQDWLAIEVIPSIRKTGSYNMVDTSQLSPELQMFKQIFDSVAQTQLKQREQDYRIEQVEQQQENITHILLLNPTEWRAKVNKIINQISMSRGGYEQYQKVRNESYELLEQRAHCKLGIRLENRRKNLLMNGVSNSKASKVTKLDVIADDARLTEIYLAIVKELAISNQVNAEGLGA
ncbi:BRO family protein [Viridibacillus arvi]|uniref:BRO-N domain-containing protein n=1 Tax=Viridibacillus arvi TaxID=263475 RepID=UPI003D2AA193